MLKRFSLFFALTCSLNACNLVAITPNSSLSGGNSSSDQIISPNTSEVTSGVKESFELRHITAAHRSPDGEQVFYQSIQKQVAIFDDNITRKSKSDSLNDKGDIWLFKKATNTSKILSLTAIEHPINIQSEATVWNNNEVFIINRNQSIRLNTETLGIESVPKLKDIELKSVNKESIFFTDLSIKGLQKYTLATDSVETIYKLPELHTPYFFFRHDVAKDGSFFLVTAAKRYLTEDILTNPFTVVSTPLPPEDYYIVSKDKNTRRLTSLPDRYHRSFVALSEDNQKGLFQIDLPGDIVDNNVNVDQIEIVDISGDKVLNTIKGQRAVWLSNERVMIWANDEMKVYQVGQESPLKTLQGDLPKALAEGSLMKIPATQELVLCSQRSCLSFDLKDLENIQKKTLISITKEEGSLRAFYNADFPDLLIAHNPRNKSQSATLYGYSSGSPSLEEILTLPYEEKTVTYSDSAQWRDDR